MGRWQEGVGVGREVGRRREVRRGGAGGLLHSCSCIESFTKGNKTETRTDGEYQIPVLIWKTKRYKCLIALESRNQTDESGMNGHRPPPTPNFTRGCSVVFASLFKSFSKGHGVRREDETTNPLQPSTRP